MSFAQSSQSITNYRGDIITTHYNINNQCIGTSTSRKYINGNTETTYYLKNNVLKNNSCQQNTVNFPTYYRKKRKKIRIKLSKKNKKILKKIKKGKYIK